MGEHIKFILDPIPLAQLVQQITREEMTGIGLKADSADTRNMTKISNTAYTPNYRLYISQRQGVFISGIHDFKGDDKFDAKCPILLSSMKIIVRTLGSSYLKRIIPV
jgi:hypothetical protein